MKEVLVRTKPKGSFTLVLSDNSANIQTAFSPPLHLQANRTIHSQIFEITTIRPNGVLVKATLGQYSTYQLDVVN